MAIWPLRGEASDGRPPSSRVELAAGHGTATEVTDGADGGGEVGTLPVRVALGPARHCDRLDVTVPQITVSAAPGLARIQCRQDGYRPILEIVPQLRPPPSARDGPRARTVEITAHYE